MAGELVTGERVGDPGSGVSLPGSVAEPGGGNGAVSGPVVAFRAWLASVDVAGLSDRERVDLVGELERVKGPVCAVQARATDAYRCSRQERAPRDVARSVGSEVALARRESPSLGDRFVGLSRALVHEMPHTMAALEAGVCGERHAVAVVAASACLSVADRGEVDRRVGPVLGRLGVTGAARAAARVAAELDAASVVARMEAAVASRRTSVRPAPDGMAYLTVLGPLRDVVGAHAALLARSRAVVAGRCPEEAPAGRGVGAVASDTALALLSGRGGGQVQPVQVHLVMTDRALLGTGDPDRSVFEPARVPGHGSVPAPAARAWLRGVGEGSVWLRRLYTYPTGRDLVAMDSRRRVFGGLLRRMLVLRDEVCTTPWCQAPVVHADHTMPVRQGGATHFVTGSGTCARCNYVKEAPGWAVRVIHPGPLPLHLATTHPPAHVDRRDLERRDLARRDLARRALERRDDERRDDVAHGDAVDGDASSPSDARRRRVPRKRRPATSARRPREPSTRKKAPRQRGPSWDRPREIEVSTPTGRTYRAQAPPLTGWGWEPVSHQPAQRRKRPRIASRLERHLVDLLAAVA